MDKDRNKDIWFLIMEIFILEIGIITNFLGKGFIFLAIMNDMKDLLKRAKGMVMDDFIIMMGEYLLVIGLKIIKMDKVF